MGRVPAGPALSPEREAALLEPWRSGYLRRFGVAPSLERDEHGLRLRFPAHETPEYAYAVGRVDVFGGHAGVREHLRRVGFAWDERGRLVGAPSPASAPARLRALGLQEGPLPSYYQGGVRAIAVRTWLEGCLRGEVPLWLGDRRYYGVLALGLWERGRVRRGRDHHFFGVQHDLTKHLALTHLIPRPLLLALGRRIAAGLRPWHRGPLMSAPLVRFYENDLLSYCQSVWRDLPEPAAFVPTFTARGNAAQLDEAIARRLEASAAGPLAWRGADCCPRFEIER